MTPSTVARLVDSPVGPLTLTASDAGLRGLWFGARRDIGLGEHPVLDDAAAQLRAYFAGQRRAFDLPLDLAGAGTQFQVAAWLALVEIPYGETVSYGEQARRLGRPAAVRAVGAANGRNPIAIVLPCHRLVGADGSLTGFGGGLEAKRTLLDLERGELPRGLSWR